MGIPGKGKSVDLGSGFVQMYEERINAVIPGVEDMYDMAYSFLKLKLPQKARLLIAGVGPGKDLVHFGSRNSDWEIDGVDPLPEMIKAAEEKLVQYNLKANLHLGYVDDLPLKPVYDGASAIFVIHWLPDDDKKMLFLNSISARLKPGAVFIHVTVQGVQGSNDYQVTQEAWKNFQVKKGRTPEEIDELYKIIENDIYPVPSDKKAIALLNDAGFVDVQRFYTGYFISGWMAFKKQ